MTKAAITRVSNLEVSTSKTSNNGFYAPRLTTAQITAIPASILVNGAIVYNTTTNRFQNYIDGAWNVLNSSVATAGEGLTGTSVILPSGEENDVQVTANEIVGFIYYDTTNNVIKFRTNAAWATVAVV